MTRVKVLTIGLLVTAMAQYALAADRQPGDGANCNAQQRTCYERCATHDTECVVRCTTEAQRCIQGNIRDAAKPGPTYTNPTDEQRRRDEYRADMRRRIDELFRVAPGFSDIDPRLSAVDFLMALGDR